MTDPIDRAADRIVADYPVDIEEEPDGTDVVQGPVGQKPTQEPDDSA